jgi:glycosyltransferase involved in cell wall biosynthesis
VDFNPQQVIVPWWVTFWGPAFHHIISRLNRRNIPITILIHNTMPHEPKPWDQFLAYRTLKGGDRFIVMTEKEKERLEDLLPEVDKVEVVPHPVYQIFKPSSLSKDEIRSRLGLPTEKPIILFFGFVRPYKGLSDLIKALKIIHNMKFEIHLLIAGEFWQSRDSYDEYVSTFGLNNYVHIFDNYISDDEAAQFFQAADLFVAPYTEGSQSGALKSALGFGLPSVVTNKITDKLIRNLPELCEIIPSGKPRELADVIIKKLGSPMMEKEQVNLIFESSWNTLLKALIE